MIPKEFIENGIKKSSVHRLLRAQKLKPYIPRLIHALNEDDPDWRLQFCEWFLHKCGEREDFQDSIVCSDEAIFKLNGTINGHNCVYWANENSNIIEERTANCQEQRYVMVCLFQRINCAVLLRRDCHRSDLPANVVNHYSTS